MDAALSALALRLSLALIVMSAAASVKSARAKGISAAGIAVKMNDARANNTRTGMGLLDAGNLARESSKIPAQRGQPAPSGAVRGAQVARPKQSLEAGPVGAGENRDGEQPMSSNGRTAERRDVDSGNRRQASQSREGVDLRKGGDADGVDVADSAEPPASDDAGRLLGSIDAGASIYLRMWRVANEFGTIRKDAKMAEKAGGYDYATIDSILARVRTLFDKHGVLLVPNLVSVSQDGNRTISQFDVAFVNVDAPTDQMVVRVPAYANDNGDKGPPKVTTQAIKTAIKAVLNLTTKEDEDANVPEHKSATTQGEEVAAAKDRARDAVHKWATAYKLALTNARNVKELEQIKRANATQLNDKDLPEVTWAFLDELFSQRKDALEKIEAAQ